jgi:PiT family inorganic phosphate transporter
VFDFMNGFHDAANSIATVVSTGVLNLAGRAVGGILQRRRGAVHPVSGVAATVGKGSSIRPLSTTG